MSLSSYRLHAQAAVTDMARAEEFYEGKLGLSAVRAGADGSKVYGSGGEASLVVYPSPDHAGGSTATLATWYVDDVEQRLRLPNRREGNLTPRRRRQSGLVQGSRRQHLFDRE